MANLEWDIPHELISIYGGVLLNVPDGSSGLVYRIQSGPYKMIPSLRVTQDNVSQADGSVLRPRWKSGLTSIIQIGFNKQLDPEGVEFEPACGQELREMEEELLLNLNAIRSQQYVGQSLLWTPTGTGGARRMMPNIELLAIWDPSYDLNGVETLMQFAVESPLPYAMGEDQTATEISDGSTVTITNDGNCPESPIIRVHGDTDAFTIQNNDDFDSEGTALLVEYDGTRPGAVNIPGGDYGQIVFFDGTILLGSDNSDLIAGISPSTTDFWHLNPGDNNITATGADITVYSNNAWA